jgi:hypothetical protein
LLATVDPEQLKKLGKKHGAGGHTHFNGGGGVTHPQPNRAFYKCVITYFQFKKTSSKELLVYEKGIEFLNNAFCESFLQKC